MATGVKISALPVATSFDSTDLMPIVEGGVTKSVTHDVLMDDTQICKAWVNFNGTGTVAIRDDFNVSSITDEGTGDYTVNFTNALNDVDYSVLFGGGLDSVTGSVGALIGIKTASGTAALKTTTSLTVRSVNQSFAVADIENANVSIFGS